MSAVRIPMYQVDVFTSRVFAGNPAAICPLETWLSDEQMQSIAAENNVSNTAFFVPAPGGYKLRWFTPKVEVELCGHATLGSAYVIFNSLTPSANSVRFETKSGWLTVDREGDLFSLDFPARPASACEVHRELVAALGAQPETILGARDYLAIYRTEEEVRALDPNMDMLARIDRFAVIVTSPGNQVDFVSRFFAPARGIPEDPVTGSSHCTLIPYWAERLGKKKLRANQVSPRGGELWCEHQGDRVTISGKAVQFFEGTICL